MKLGNILAQKGGIPETGRPVRFQIRSKLKDGKTVRHWADALLLPVSEQDRAKANAAAAEYCSSTEGAPDLVDERVYRFLQQSLHDADSPATLFVLDDQMANFRSGVNRDQVDWLYTEYKQHIRDEYSELLPRKEAEAMEKQAEDFSSGGPPSS